MVNGKIITQRDGNSTKESKGSVRNKQTKSLGSSIDWKQPRKESISLKTMLITICQTETQRGRKKRQNRKGQKKYLKE